MKREKPTNLQAEPAYYGLEDLTALFSIAYPYLTAHLPNKYCSIEEPHEIKDCPFWQTAEKWWRGEGFGSRKP